MMSTPHNYLALPILRWHVSKVVEKFEFFCFLVVVKYTSIDRAFQNEANGVFFAGDTFWSESVDEISSLMLVLQVFQIVCPH
jgi:hypothetical protein